jgi:hypothetical protein
MGLIALSLALMAAGLFVALVGASRLRRAKLLRTGGEARATVVRTRWDFTPMLFDPLGGPSTRPVLRFTPAGGGEIETKAGTPPEHVRAGDAVQVRYDVADPRRAELDSWVRVGGNGAVLAVGGVALAVIGALLIALAIATM